MLIHFLTPKKTLKTVKEAPLLRITYMKNIFHSRGESAFSKIMSNFSELYKTIHNMGLIYLKQIIVTSDTDRPVITLHKNMSTSKTYFLSTRICTHPRYRLCYSNVYTSIDCFCFPNNNSSLYSRLLC